MLGGAIKATFERRETEINTISLTVFDEVFMKNESKQVQWKAFLRRNAMKSEMSFSGLMIQLQSFLEPIYQQAASNEVKDEYWSSEDWLWKQG